MILLVRKVKLTLHGSQPLASNNDKETKEVKTIAATTAATISTAGLILLAGSLTTFVASIAAHLGPIMQVLGK